MHIQSRTAMVDAFKLAVFADNVREVTTMLDTQEPVRRVLNEPMFEWGLPPLGAARSTIMADLLLRYGADIDVLSHWWRSGLWVIESIETFIGRHLVRQGAVLTVHAAAALGLSDHLEPMLNNNKTLANMPNDDGCRPLHFARTPEIAALLIHAGAEVNVLDDDHDSSPIQWRIGDGPEVPRYLLAHAAVPDIFVAAALGDSDLTLNLINADPACVAYRIGSNRGPFPGIGFQGNAGTILQWSVGFNLSPHETALRFGHQALFDLLWSHSPVKTRFLVACMCADRPTAEAIKSKHPHIIGSLDDEDLALLTKCCSDTNYNLKAVRLMLDLGFPVATNHSDNECSSLHHAASCGYADITALLLKHGHPPDFPDENEGTTPLLSAVYGAIKAKRHPEGNYARVVHLLLEFGATVPENMYPTGDSKIDKVLASVVQS